MSDDKEKKEKEKEREDFFSTILRVLGIYYLINNVFGSHNNTTGASVVEIPNDTSTDVIGDASVIDYSIQNNANTQNDSSYNGWFTDVSDSGDSSYSGWFGDINDSNETSSYDGWLSDVSDNTDLYDNETSYDWSDSSYDGDIDSGGSSYDDNSSGADWDTSSFGGDGGSGFDSTW